MTTVIRLENIAGIETSAKACEASIKVAKHANLKEQNLVKEHLVKEQKESLTATSNFKAARVLFEEGVLQNVYPGAVLQVGSSASDYLTACVGVRGLSSFVDPDSITDDQDHQDLKAHAAHAEKLTTSINTVYDLGSLTQVIVTATLAMKMLGQNTLRLDDKIARYLQGFGVNQKSDITLEHILAHTSGLPYMPHYFEDLVKLSGGQRFGIMGTMAAKEHIYSAINKLSAKNKPGKAYLKTEAGLVLLGQIIELLTGVNLGKIAAKSIFGPLNMKSTSYIDLGLLRRRALVPDKDLIAPTEDCVWRQRLLWGEVFDDNAWAMGGISGHSGLFSCLNDISIFAKELLKGYRGQSTFFSQELVRQFWLGIDFQKKERLPFIWEHAKRDNFMNESGLSHLAVGINSATGCSLWFEPEKDLYIILLSNSVHPQRGSKKLQTLRPLLFQEILKQF